MAWYSRRPVIERAVPHVVGPNRSIGDPALAEYFGLRGTTAAGVNVTESSALGLTSLWRGLNLTANTVAGLPLKTYAEKDGVREEAASFLDEPGGDMWTAFEWMQFVMVCLLLHGNSFLLHVYTEGGSLAYLWPLHPSMVQVRWDADRSEKVYKVTINGESTDYTDADVTHLMGLSIDGLQGVSPLRAMRDMIGTSIAGNDAAGTVFANGLSVAMLVTPDEDMEEDDGKVVASSLRTQLTGTRNTNGVAFMNYNLKAQQLSMNSEEAQFLESRQFQVAEVARFVGCPVQLLMQDGASSWGSGIQELIIAWVKFTLRGFTTPIQQKLSRLISSSKFCEFEYKALLQGSPKEEIELLVMQKDAGILTVDEIRGIMNLPPLTKSEKEEIAPPATGGSTEAASPPSTKES